MSHISTAKIKITNVIPEIAERAFENIANQHGFNYSRNQVVSAYDNTKKRVQHCFSGRGFEDYNGIGVNLVNGEMQMVGEFWSSDGTRRTHLENLKQYLANGYNAEAYRESLMEMGCSVEMSYTPNGDIMIEGEVLA